RFPCSCSGSPRLLPLSLHDALPISELFQRGLDAARATGAAIPALSLKDTIKRVAHGRVVHTPARAEHVAVQTPQIFRRDVLERADRKSTRLNSSHVSISYAVFCLKK